MKPITFTSLFLLMLTSTTFSQDLSISKTASAELTKASRAGRYGGTFINGDQAKVLYVTSTKDDGAQVEEYNFDISGGQTVVQDKFIGETEAKEQLPWFIPKSKVENMATANGKWLKAGSVLFGGTMKLWRGKMKKQYYLDVFTGMEFVEEESIKPKTEDIWRLTPGGFKSLSKVDALAEDYGFYRELKKYGTSLTMPASSDLLAAGIITEKISIKNPPPTANNRVAVLTMNGMDFNDMKYDIYLLPYTATTIGSGLGQDDNLCSLFAPLNGPTTVKALKHLYWKDKKDHFTLMRFNDQRQLVDSTSFRSKLMWGDFAILNGQGSTYVIGKGKAGFDGWFRGLQYNKVTGIQVTKIKDGNELFTKMYTEDELVSKLVGPGGNKVKFNMYVPRNDFKEVIDLPNGDILILGQTPLEEYILQITSAGDLKAFYLLPLGKKDKIGINNYQYMMKDNDLILVVNLQPVEFSTAAQFETNSYKFSGAYTTTTVTTTTVTKLNEVFMQSMVFRIKPDAIKLSNALALDGKNFYPMGSFPAMFTKDAIYFTGREKGPKGKVIHVAKVDL